MSGRVVIDCSVMSNDAPNAKVSFALEELTHFRHNAMAIGLPASGNVKPLMTICRVYYLLQCYNELTVHLAVALQENGVGEYSVQPRLREEFFRDLFTCTVVLHATWIS